MHFSFQVKTTSFDIFSLIHSPIHFSDCMERSYFSHLMIFCHCICFSWKRKNI